MYETNYHRVASLAEAETALAAAPDGKLLAGGQTLLPTMKQRLAAPSHVIDIARISELQGIEVQGEALVIGAGVKHSQVAGSSAVAGSIPALATLAGLIGDPHVRHMGTLGGSIANNDPAADYPAGLLGLGATVHTNKRAIAADDFFTGYFETALEDDEIIVRVSFPVPSRSGYAKFANQASRYAMVGVYAAQMRDGSCRVAVTGAGDGGVFRVSEMETALAANWSADALSGTGVPPNSMASDIHGSAEYRAHLVGVMAQRAVAAAS